MLISFMLGTSSNYGSPNGSGPDLDGRDQRSINAQFPELRDIMSLGFADFGNPVKIISDAVGAFTSRISSVEQKMAMFTTLEQNVNTSTENVNYPTTRICQIESNATPIPDSSGSARSWNLRGQCVGSTATGSLGSHALGHLMTTEIQDVDFLRLEALTTNKHEAPCCYDSHASNISLELRSGSITSWKKPASHQKAGQARPTVKQVPYRPDSSSKQEISLRNLWSYTRMMASSMRSTPFCVLLKLLSWFAVPGQLENVNVENNLCPCGERLLTNFELSCMKEMTRDHLLSQPLMSAHKFLELGTEETA